MQVQRVPALLISLLPLLLVATGAGPAAAASDTPLPDAAKTGDHAAVSRLLEAGIDVDAPESDGTTALHWAVYRDDAELAVTLIDAGADANVVRGSTSTATAPHR